MTVKNIELGRDARGSTLGKIEKAFSTAKPGVVFIDRGDTRDGGAGVRLRK
jgi:hypothetical protein